MCITLGMDGETTSAQHCKYNQGTARGEEEGGGVNKVVGAKQEDVDSGAGFTSPVQVCTEALNVKAVSQAVRAVGEDIRPKQETVYKRFVLRAANTSEDTLYQGVDRAGEFSFGGGGGGSNLPPSVPVNLVTTTMPLGLTCGAG